MTNNIQVLLAIADRDLAQRLSAQFLELADMQVVGVENDSADVLSAAGGIPGLDVILLHQDLPPVPALELVKELGIRHPHLAVILVAEEATAETFATAMAAGARGLIAHNPTLSELQNRVEASAEWSRTMRKHFDSSYSSGLPSRLGRMVTLCGAKGGTGTTSIAIHLAAAVHAAKRTVCVVDMDLQKGDLPSYLDVQHRRSISDLVAAADDLDGTVLSEALFVHPSGPHLLLAPADGEQGEDIPARAARQILAALRSRYDVVIVDCGAYMFESSAMAVELADQVVVVATPDLPALRGARRLVKMWHRLQVRKEEDIVVLLNRHDRRNEIQPDLARKILGLSLLNSTIPSTYRALEEAANTGVPTAVKSTDFRKSIGALMRETGLLEDPAHQQPLPKDAGVALTEFAVIVPLIGLVLLLVWQAVLVGLTSMYSSHAANEAARSMAVLGYRTPQAQQAVHDRVVKRIPGPWNDNQHLTIRETGNGYAEVSIRTDAVLPGLRTPFEITTKAKIVNEDN